MLIVKTNPTGLDIPIQRLQSMLHAELLTGWGITTDQYECYGRCYRNKISAGYIAENYAGNGEYKEVYWNDTLSAISFFGIDSRVEFDMINRINVHLVFFVNLAKIKPSILHYGDEEARKDVQKIVETGLYGFEFKGFELWLDRVLREYPGSRRDERLIAVEMHPVHCFRVNMELTYDKNIC